MKHGEDSVAHPIRRSLADTEAAENAAQNLLHVDPAREAPHGVHTPPYGIRDQFRRKRCVNHPKRIHSLLDEMALPRVHDFPGFPAIPGRQIREAFDQAIEAFARPNGDSVW